MGTLTLTELKEELKASLGNRSDLDTRLTRFLNLAQQRLSRLHDFDEMEVISKSTLPFTADATKDKYITLPNLREVYSFKIILGQRTRRMRQIPQRMWNRMVPAPQEYARGEAQLYTIWASTCIVWPIANAASIPIELWHTKWPEPFLDSNPTLTSEYKEKDEILIELGLVYAYHSLGKHEVAQKHWTRARPLLVEAIQTDQKKPDLDILPGLGDTEIGGDMLPHEYWTDPFVREAPG